jgi:glutaredoxin-like YruB-family protein
VIKWIKHHKHLGQVQEEHEKFLILSFYGNFSSASNRALAELEKFSKENKEMPIYIIDVEKVKGVHKQFEVENVPTVLVLEKDKVTRRIEGVESAQFYTKIFFGAAPSGLTKGKKTVSHSVVVYSGASCPACGAAKSYLRRRGVRFRDIDISRDPHAAERLVQRTGRMAVPQILIDGRLVVGFDQAKIDRLLSN